MHKFHDRIAADECSKIWLAAQRAGFLDIETCSLIVHDLGRMRRRIRLLHEAFPAGTLHALAIKANPLVEVLREAVQSGAGLEAASMEEVYLAVAAKCPTDQIVFDSPAKTPSEIGEALELGVFLNANSFDELDRIALARKTRTTSSPIGLRVNPELRSGTIAATSVGHTGSKFGVPMDTARDQIFEAFLRWNWLGGLHVHVGSQGCSLDLLTSAVDKVNRLRRDLEIRIGRELDFIDIGGGLPAVYKSNQTSPSPSEYVAQLDVTVSDLMKAPARLVTEFGRAVQAGCGLTFSRVEYVRPEQSMAVIHVGADHLMRPVYASQDWEHEFLVLSPQGEVKQTPVRPLTIAGPLCFSGDVIARDIELPVVEPGDWIVVRDTGAYTLSMWSRHCSRSIPTVIGYDSANETPIRMLRQAESPASITRFWSVDADFPVPNLHCDSITDEQL